MKRSVGDDVNWTDALVTVLVTILGAFDVVRGVADYVLPTSRIGVLSFCGQAFRDCDAVTVRIARVRGAECMAYGTAFCTLAAFRVLRWWHRRVFDSRCFVVLLSIDAACNLCKLAVLLQPSATYATLVGTELLRGSVALLSTCLATSLLI
jgi:hypothetical protein